MRLTADQDTWELFVKLFLQYTIQPNVWKTYARDVRDSAASSETESDDAWEREQREIEEFKLRGGF